MNNYTTSSLFRAKDNQSWLGGRLRPNRTYSLTAKSVDWVTVKDTLTGELLTCETKYLEEVV